MKLKEAKGSQRKLIETNWKQLKLIEAKRNQMKSNETKWSQKKPKETNRNKLKLIKEIKWNQLRLIEGKQANISKDSQKGFLGFLLGLYCPSYWTQKNINLKTKKHQKNLFLYTHPLAFPLPPLYFLSLVVIISMLKWSQRKQIEANWSQLKPIEPNWTQLKLIEASWT